MPDNKMATANTETAVAEQAGGAHKAKAPVKGIRKKL